MNNIKPPQLWKWALGIALSSITALVAIQTVNTPNAEPPTETSAPAYEGCSFVWASYDEMELSQKIDSAVKILNPNASAKATLFGEDCIYADGSKTFGAMETNFSVRLLTEDLTQWEKFGNWMKQVMEIVAEIPREEIQGGYGFVEFWFEKNESESIIFRAPIQQYLNEAKDKSGAELFEYFYKQ
jgi:hypothetical protein